MQAAGILKPKLHASLPSLRHVLTHSHVAVFLAYLCDLFTDKALRVLVSGNLKKIKGVCVSKSYEMSLKRSFTENSEENEVQLF